MTQLERLLRQAVDLILDMSQAFPSSDPRYRRAASLAIVASIALREQCADGPLCSMCREATRAAIAGRRLRRRR